MTARHHRSAIILAALALAVFIVRWPVDNYICNPQTWHSTTQKDKAGKPLLFRLPPQENADGENFFSIVLRGGGGTPAVFAMLGGQRYLVANILWNYSDVLFHAGKPFQMVDPLESAVTLNPSFTEAWSVYGWHLAWNLHTYTKTDPAKQAFWLDAGEAVYRRAVEANPDKPRPYFDLAWLYIQRKGEYEHALPLLQHVVYGKDEKGKRLFQPLPMAEKKAAEERGTSDYDMITEKKWDVRVYGHRLAFVYRKLGIINRDWELIQKAIDTFRECKRLDPDDDTAVKNINTLTANFKNEQWMEQQFADEENFRERFGMSPIGEANHAPSSQFSDQKY